MWLFLVDLLNLEVDPCSTRLTSWCGVDVSETKVSSDELFNISPRVTCVLSPVVLIAGVVGISGISLVQSLQVLILILSTKFEIFSISDTSLLDTFLNAGEYIVVSEGDLNTLCVLTISLDIPFLSLAVF